MELRNPITKENVERILGKNMERNYDKLFRSLEEEFPGWVSFEYLNKKYNFNFILEDDLISLENGGFLVSKEDYKIIRTESKSWSVVTGKDGKPVKERYFKLSGKGFEFINNLRVRETNLKMNKINKFLLVLTIILSVSGVFQIALLIWQIILQYRALG